MIFQIAKFEIKYWLRQPMLYIFFTIIALLVFGASSSEQITIGERVEMYIKMLHLLLRIFMR